MEKTQRPRKDSSWCVVACTSSHSTERERQKRKKEQKVNKEKNTEYFKSTNQVSPQVLQALDLKAPKKKETKQKKKKVPVGKRKLGPGFLQRYGTSTETNK